MATVGSLMIDIGANVARLDKDMQHVKSSIDGLSTHIKGRLDFAKTWQGMAAGIASVTYMIDRAGAAFNKAWDLAEGAAQYEEMKKGLAGLSAQYGMTADAAIAMAKEAVGGQLSMKEAGDLAAKAFTLGFNPKQLEGFLIQAEKLTDVVGGDIPSALEAMERAAATGRSRGLVAYGIVVDLTKAIDEYARKNGISKSALSEHTLMQIRANAIMEETKRRTDLMGEATESTADKMNVLKATVADIQLWLGTATIRAALGATGSLEWLAAGALTAYAAILKLQEITALINWKGLNLQPEFARTPEQQANIDAAKKQYEDIAGSINAANEAAMALTGKAAKNMEAALASSSQLAAILNKIPGAKESSGGKPISEADWKKSILPEGYVRELELFGEYTTANEGFLKDSEKSWTDFYKKRTQKFGDSFNEMLEETNNFFKEEEGLWEDRNRILLKMDERYRADKLTAYENLWVGLAEINSMIGGEMGAGLGGIMGGAKKILSIGAQTDTYSTMLDQQNKYLDNSLKAAMEGRLSEAEFNDQINNYLITSDAATLQQRYAAYQAYGQMTLGAITAVGSMIQGKSLALFMFEKAAMIAMTLISAHAAAAAALAPPPLGLGPVAGMPLSASVLTFGYAQAAIIGGLGLAQLALGGGGEGQGTALNTPRGAALSGMSAGENVIATPATQTGQRNQIINFYIYGNVYDEKKLARELQPYLEQAQNDGVR